MILTKKKNDSRKQNLKSIKHISKSRKNGLKSKKNMRGGGKIGNKFKGFGEAVRSKVKGVFGSKSRKYPVTPQNGTSMKGKSKNPIYNILNPITKSVISINPIYNSLRRPQNAYENSEQFTTPNTLKIVKSREAHKAQKAQNAQNSQKAQINHKNYIASLIKQKQTEQTRTTEQIQQLQLHNNAKRIALRRLGITNTNVLTNKKEEYNKAYKTAIDERTKLYIKPKKENPHGIMTSPQNTNLYGNGTYAKILDTPYYSTAKEPNIYSEIPEDIYSKKPKNIYSEIENIYSEIP